ncbi:hypothetical protein AB4Z25_17910 [Rhizobium sp. RAF36]|jgi:hypothetical protein|uniref:hypothetical protein n=1 Tax=Rhizobium sp. RAF36 TaxID=3233055 RepID=UPI003F991532
MTHKDTLQIDADNKDLVDFLERLRDAGELRVQLNGDFFRVSLTKETSAKGRRFLMEGGVLDDE